MENDKRCKSNIILRGENGQKVEIQCGLDKHFDKHCAIMRDEKISVIMIW